MITTIIFRNPRYSNPFRNQLLNQFDSRARDKNMINILNYIKAKNAYLLMIIANYTFDNQVWTSRESIKLISNQISLLSTGSWFAIE